MLFSVIVPIKNEVKHIEHSVLSLLDLDDRGLGFEILLIDGNSTDGTFQLLFDKFGHNSKVSLLHNPRGYTPSAFNIGIGVAKGDYILIAGARHKLARNYAIMCISDLERDKKIGVVGGLAIHQNEGEVSESIAYAMTSKFGVGGQNFRAINKSAFVDTVGTPVYNKEIFDEIGIFDEALIRNQDDELNYRLHLAGYKAWLNVNALVTYTVRSNFYSLWRQYQQYGYWKIYVNKKHKTVTTFRQIIPALFVVYLFILPFIFILFNFALIILLLPLIGYIFSIIIITRTVKFNIYKSFLVSKSFLILHLSYGLGYLKGILDFLILRKSPDSKMIQLSR